jgi:cobalt/nickel transport system permease protein
MGAAHGHRLHYHGHSPVHRWPAHLKVLGLLGFMLVVVATPKEWFAAFGVYLVVLGAVVALSRVPPTYLLKRLVIEVPFLLFALLLPFVAQGPQIEVLGLTVSEHGLLAAWGLLAKGTLGVLASLTLAATTEPHDLLAGLERLRLPAQLVEIMAFMIRYLDVVTDEMQRMKVARTSRGFSARSWRAPPALCSSAPTSVANASTWRCCPAGTTDACRGKVTDERPRSRRPGARVRLPRRPPGVVRRRSPGRAG